MRKYVWQISILLILSMLTINALAEPSVEHRPKIPIPKPHKGTASGASLNWAGYALNSPVGSVTNVNGSWIVPAVTCSNKNTYSSFWVGIDGSTDNTVEQIGTESDCSSGRPNYYAWYEFYPAGSVNGIIPVSPGDYISAEVTYIGNNQFNVSIIDHNNSQSFSTIGSVSNAQRSSAEWIAEAPSNFVGNVLPLANFGTADYGFDYTGDVNTSYATISGTTGNISSFSSSSSVTIDGITMVTISGRLKAQPSAVSSDGTSFSVQWYHS